MKVFKSWLIANYENIMAVILVALFEIMLFTSDTISMESKNELAGMGAFMLLLMIGIVC